MLKYLLLRYKCSTLAKCPCVTTNAATRSAEGVTLIELLVTMAFIGVLSALAAPVLSGNFGIRPLDDSTNRVASTLNLLRVKATSQTTAYRFRQSPGNPNVFLVEYSGLRNPPVANDGTCNATNFQSDGSFNIDDRTLGKNVSFATVTANPVVTPWSVCFDSRGQADRSLDISLASYGISETRRIKVFEGGSIQVY